MLVPLHGRELRGGEEIRAWGMESDCVGPACLERAWASIPHGFEQRSDMIQLMF